MTASPPHHTSFITPAWILALALLIGLAVTGVRVVGWIRMAPGTPLPAQALADIRQRTAVDARAPGRPEAGPSWGELTTSQKEALYPLANRWSVLTEVQKRHWLKLAAEFHTLEPDEQEKMLARLTDWSSLSAQQRSQARLNYAATNALKPDSKRAKWEAYQALSEDERKRLAAKAQPRPAGAAPAVRPSPRKLARVPAASNAPAAIANPPKIPRPSQAHIPQALPVPVPAPAPAPAPVVVETRPVETPSALGSALPPLPPEPSQEREPPPVSGSAAPLHPPQ